MRPGSLLSSAAWMAALIAVFLVGERCLLSAWTVAGPSMEPVLLAGDRVLADRWTLERRSPRAGEVIVLLGPDGEPMIKRVVEAPPDRRGLRPRPDLWSIAPGQPVWVRGDRADRSLDSRRFGPVPSSRIRGRVVLRYWPPRRFGPVR